MINKQYKNTYLQNIHNVVFYDSIMIVKFLIKLPIFQNWNCFLKLNCTRIPINIVKYMSYTIILQN